MPSKDIHYFGIRHHGPGSSQRLLKALTDLQPAYILIEGPTDCSALLPLLAAKQMQPPVALLAYAAEAPNSRLFYPFAEFSPEYQATQFAVQHDVGVGFIDLPVNIQLAELVAKHSADNAEEHPEADSEMGEEAVEVVTDIDATGGDHLERSNEAIADVARDPIGALAKLSGYEDGEAWWNDLLEQSCQNSESAEAIFDTVESAMAALRDSLASSHPSLQRDQVREAYMRLEIAKARRQVEGPIAVVCGAWHVPALKEKHTAKSDRERIKTLPAKLSPRKVKATWVPWTSPRLSMTSGYGAGVAAPMWYQHLWRHQAEDDAITPWLARVTHAMRESGQVVSTASVIEAVRLSYSLAAVRNRPAPGFEEMREAVVACLCFGEQRIWQQVESAVLLGHQVGEIPPDAPLIPLIEDLQQQQKRFKLKPEALQKELSLDLRSNAGIGKSILLHRLRILEIPWGTPASSGRSRGTFRENWMLCWQPEFSVKLVENLVYGSTIEQAASQKISEAMQTEKNLSQLAACVHLCLESQLDDAAARGIALLEKQAAHTSDCLVLLNSITPLINISRYGTARALSLSHVGALIDRLTTQAALSLPYACRNLSDDEALCYRQAINEAHQALLLTDWDAAIEAQWWQGLEGIADNRMSNLQMAGLASRLLYQAERLSTDALELHLGKMLSPSVPAADAARYFDGFFTQAVEQLLYDDVLLTAIEQWLVSLDDAAFIEFLPLFRRIFADLDAMERKRMIDRVLQARTQTESALTVNTSALMAWPDQLASIGLLIRRDTACQD